MGGRLAVLFALVALVLGVTPATVAAQGPNAAAWILVDADTGAILGGNDERTPMPPASTIKLLTALIAYQRLPIDDRVRASRVAEGMPARKINLKSGQVWDRENLLLSMLLVSANDAAVALAERVGGGTLDGWEAVADTTAARLGLADDPDLSDPSGLDDEFSHDGGSRISARDLAVVARAVLAEPGLMQMIGTVEHRFDGGDGLPHRVDQRNRMFELYPGTIGMKTGLTDRAGRCLVAAATRDGRTMLAVLFDAPDMYVTAGALLDRGFATPIADQSVRPQLPAVVPGAALDPPERIPGALDTTVVSAPIAAGTTRDVDWNSAPVAIAVFLIGTVPLLEVRRRMSVSA